MIHHDPANWYVRRICDLILLLWIVRLGLERTYQLADLPLSAFRPPQPLLFLPSAGNELLFHGGGLGLIWLASLILLALSWIPALARFTLPAACLTVTLHELIVRGFNHTMNHAEIVPLFALYTLTVAAWTRAERFVPLVVATILCLTYVLTGTNRVGIGGIRVLTDDSILIWCYANGNHTTYFTFGLGRYVADHLWPPLIRFGFVVVTVVEIAAPFAIVSAWFRPWFTLTMVGFHVGVLMLMNILFAENLVYLIALFAFPANWVGQAPDAD